MNPEQIKASLAALRKELNSPTAPLLHKDQAEMPEWSGADVVVSSDFEWEPKNFMEAHDLRVRTRHAVPVTWLFLSIRDIFTGWLDASNKYGFYESLGQAALDHLAAHQPEPDAPQPLLRAVLDEASRWAGVLRETGRIPANSQCVLHLRDAEARQWRIDLDTGNEAR